MFAKFFKTKGRFKPTHNLTPLSSGQINKLQNQISPTEITNTNQFDFFNASPIQSLKNILFYIGVMAALVLFLQQKASADSPEDAPDEVIPSDILFKILTDKSLQYEIYRFIIDGDYQEMGCVTVWENREEGSFLAMLRGFIFLAQQQKIHGDQFNPASIEFLKDLHVIATKNVKNMRSNSNSSDFKNERAVCDLYLSNSDTCRINNTTPEGYLELMTNANGYQTDESKYKLDPILVGCLTFSPLNIFSSYRIGYTNSSGDIQSITTQKVQATLDVYLNDIKESKTQDDKLLAIVSCVRRLEIIHPFIDGNCRTICVLFLNALLLSNGFCPVILADPNRFDGFSTNELMRDVKRGMENTHNLLENKPLFCNDFHPDHRNTLNRNPGSYSWKDRYLLWKFFNNVDDALNELEYAESKGMVRVHCH